jgi:hypothetical protein
VFVIDTHHSCSRVVRRCGRRGSAGETEEDGVARKSRELAQRPAVDPHEEPSAEWGWHGSFSRGKIIAGVVCILILVAFIFGPYQSRTQDLWLVGAILVLLFMIWRRIKVQRNAWRR